MKIGIYLRLSVNNDIESQRKIIYNYIKEKNLIYSRITEYEDNGFTGTTEKRPAFLRLLADCRQGRISCVIVKDVSRLARDYKVSGGLIDFLFPSLNIRFISINDSFDSSAACSSSAYAVPIKNIAASMYSSDLSKKIHFSKKALSENGVYLCSVCPFGYKKGALKNSLEIDTENSNTVKYIFNEVIHGKKLIDIAKDLNSQGTKEALWTPPQIRKIIQNKFYTGAFKSFENHHAALVSDDIFLLANNSLKKRKSNGYSQNKSRLLKGKVFCGGCKHLLYYKGEKIKFFCPKKKYTSSSPQCFDGILYEDDLVNIIRSTLKDKANKIAQDEIMPLVNLKIKSLEKSIKRTEYLIKVGTKNPEKQKNKLSSLNEEYKKISSLDISLSDSELCSLIDKIEVYNDKIKIFI